MAPIPATTNILTAKYEGVFGTRTVSCRFSTATTSANAATAFRAYLLASVVPIWQTTTLVTGWSWRAQGSTFSLPIASPGAVVGTVAGSLGAVDFPRFLSVSGRGTSDGREARMFFYGSTVAQQPDYRFTGTDSTAVSALWTQLPTLIGAGGLRTPGGSPTEARPYANSGVSGYYQRKARGSA